MEVPQKYDALGIVTTRSTMQSSHATVCCQCLTYHSNLYVITRTVLFINFNQVFYGVRFAPRGDQTYLHDNMIIILVLVCHSNCDRITACVQASDRATFSPVLQLRHAERCEQGEASTARVKTRVSMIIMMCYRMAGARPEC